MCWNSWGLLLHLKRVTNPKITYLRCFEDIQSLCSELCSWRFLARTRHSIFRASRCAPCQAPDAQPDPGPACPQKLWGLLHHEPLSFQRDPSWPGCVWRLVPAARGAELPHCSALLNCASSTLGLLSWSVSTRVSVSPLGLDTGPRTARCDAPVALPQRLAGDAGPEAHLGVPCAWRERETVAGHGSVAQCFGNRNHPLPGARIQEPVSQQAREPRLSLQRCEKVKRKLQPTSPSACILLSVSIWLLHPMQHQRGWSTMSYLGWGSWLGTAQIKDQMQTFTLGSCHLKYAWVELILFQRKWKLSGFFLLCPSHSLFLFIETGLIQAFI